MTDRPVMAALRSPPASQDPSFSWVFWRKTSPRSIAPSRASDLAAEAELTHENRTRVTIALRTMVSQSVWARRLPRLRAVGSRGKIDEAEGGFKQPGQVAVRPHVRFQPGPVALHEAKAGGFLAVVHALRLDHVQPAGNAGLSE